MILRVITHITCICHLMPSVKISLEELLIITIRTCLMQRLLHPTVLDIVNGGATTSRSTSVLIHEGLVIHILIFCHIMIILLM